MGDNGRDTGVVKWSNNKKGYGFISQAAGDDVFVHHSVIIAEGFHSLADGDQVEFAIQQDQNGRAAMDVRKI